MTMFRIYKWWIFTVAFQNRFILDKGAGFKLTYRDSASMIHFSFIMIVSPTIPDNHDTKINFGFPNQETKANLFLALRLKTILIWCVSCFLLKQWCFCCLDIKYIFQYKLESVFVVIHFSYVLFLFVHWYNTV